MPDLVESDFDASTAVVAFIVVEVARGGSGAASTAWHLMGEVLHSRVHWRAGLLTGSDRGARRDTIWCVATLEDLEARVAALEAQQADYRAVLAAVNALGANQREIAIELREHGPRLSGVETRLGAVESQGRDTNTRVRSLEESNAEIKDLLIRALDR